ncbi:ABC transporter G family protein [Monoraphidium neglectum]|uniref:ABC transporter G family protein n=1 Tax=Monoraphidium neglectum TaxID=145388 RepID=A0A0D2NUS5_9CHLO|nr:ABC transporter G family protein [Monoraphidium neglectum]KIZ07841.1 ABC transporter G family protein [Monoraphidium neglectum]|eukprot:XP_013906860.1 ABC transporter G family protein [Monoraphidium neglectum]
MLELQRAAAAAAAGSRVAPTVVAVTATTSDSEAASAAGQPSPCMTTSDSIRSFAETSMNVTVKDLAYSVASNTSKRKESITLLSGITGYFEPRAMCALMGPSGSGKTTLLDLLAGRKTAGRATGEILFAGNKPTRAFLRRYTGYVSPAPQGRGASGDVEQFDTLLPSLTVEEMLLYTAELTRPRQEGRAAKRDAVEVGCTAA